MARDRLNAAPAPGRVDCDLCRKRSRSPAAAVHIFTFPDRDALAGHLREVFPDSPYCVEFFQTMYDNAHRAYGNHAREKWMPLWLVYLEDHGVKVNNRAEAIIKHRGRANSGFLSSNLPDIG